MKQTLSDRCIFSVLVLLITLLPVQLVLAASPAEVTTLEAESKKSVVADDPGMDSSEEVPVLDDSSKIVKDEPGTTPVEETHLSTGAKVGIGVGAVALVGGIVALAGGGGGGSSSTSSNNPPTADQLVDAWQANANQPGSGLTYIGTYQLYQGGSLSYSVNISDGEQFAGGGSWSLVDYALTVRTDHGSVYTGSFAPGNITSVDLNSNTGWNLYLTR